MGEVKGITPLHQAVSNKHLDAVKALVDLGADVNARATGETSIDAVVPKVLVTVFFGYAIHESVYRFCPRHSAQYNVHCNGAMLKGLDPLYKD